MVRSSRKRFTDIIIIINLGFKYIKYFALKLIRSMGWWNTGRRA